MLAGNLSILGMAVSLEYSTGLREGGTVVADCKWNGGSARACIRQ